MKIKIQQTTQTVIPRYISNGNILSLRVSDKFTNLVLPIKIVPVYTPPVYVPHPLLLFYDGSTGAYPHEYDIRTMDGRNDNPAWNALGAQRMPFTSTADPYWLWSADASDGLGQGYTTGWTNTTPQNSLRYNEGYDTSAFNYVTKREMDGLVRALVLQGVTASDVKYIYINWFEDHRDIGNFGFGSMTGPTDNIDLVTFDKGSSYIEQPRGVIAQNNLGKTKRENFTEAAATIAKIFTGGTGTDGITFKGLKYYFPNCKFGVYDWPVWSYYFHDGQNNMSLSPQEVRNRMDFYADAFINGMCGALDAFDMWMPSFYSALNSPDMNRIRAIQGVSLCTTINNKLQQLGKTPKLIIPFILPYYLTSQTGGPYMEQNYEASYYYTPPYTIMYDTDMNYEQIEPVVNYGADGATIWINSSYFATQIMGRPTNGEYEDTAPQSSWRKWPFLHPGGSTFGINQWSDKTMARQAISAHYNYIKGAYLGITGNRWWWPTASQTTFAGPAEQYTPKEWLPLGLSLAPYGNKVAYTDGTADRGATSADSTINIVREVLEDSKYRMITNFKNLWLQKYSATYAPPTRMFKVFYDGTPLGGATSSPIFDSFNSKYMPSLYSQSPFYEAYYNGQDQSNVGWLGGESLDFINKKTVNYAVRILVNQGLTLTSKNYVWMNFEQPWENYILFNGYTGPTTVLDGISQGIASNFYYKLLKGGMGSDGITFLGLKSFFPGVSFGYYGQPRWAYYPDGESWLLPDAKRDAMIDFAAKIWTGCTGLADAVDVLMPSIYSSIAYPYANKIYSEQIIQLSKKINEKLQAAGKPTKEIIPFTRPVYGTEADGGAYQGTTPNRYIPPWTFMLDQDIRYEQLEPVVLKGCDGHIIWNGNSYYYNDTVNTVGGRDSDTVISTGASWRQGPTAGVPNPWTWRQIMRQAVSAHRNYISGVCMGITGNRWWWRAGPNTETFTPQEWKPLGVNPIVGSTCSDATKQMTADIFNSAILRTIILSHVIWKENHPN